MSEVPQGNQDGHLADTEGVKALNSKADNRCVFCDRIAKGEYEAEFANYVTFEPLNPVTPGHMLVVPKVHTANLNSSKLEADQVGWALRGFTNDLEPDESYNIITSKGEAATQTIQHLHFHIVPRRKGDGLHLPWTGQVPVSDMKPSDQDADTKGTLSRPGGGSQDSIDTTDLDEIIATYDIYGYADRYNPDKNLRLFKEALTAWHNTQLKEADRKTLETIGALLNGDDNQVEVVKNYVWNKLSANSEED